VRSGAERLLVRRPDHGQSAIGPGLATFTFGSLAALQAALDRVYKLGVDLPDAPLVLDPVIIADVEP
jgi:hypothetical protein